MQLHYLLTDGHTCYSIFGSGQRHALLLPPLSLLWRHNMQSFLHSLTPKCHGACAAASAAFAASLARLSTKRAGRPYPTGVQKKVETNNDSVTIQRS